MKILRFEESIYYANVDNFKYKVLKLSKTNPAEILNRIKKDREAEQKLAKKLKVGFNYLFNITYLISSI